MLIRPYAGHAPNIKSGAYTAPDATATGDVTVEENASLWYGSVSRADVGPIHIKAYAAIEDRVVIHGAPNFLTVVGEGTVVGHNAILHGCTIGDNCWIGMGATLMNGCVIGDHCLIGAGALVTERTQIPPYSLVVGSPAKVKRPLTPEEREKVASNHTLYFKLAQDQLDKTP